MSVEQLTFIAYLKEILSNTINLNNYYESKLINQIHLNDLAKLYKIAYKEQFQISYESSKTEWKNTFKGEYGEIWNEASPMLFDNNKLIAAIVTVKIAPWKDTPKCPFIIELMVHPEYRRKNLAKLLFLMVAQTCIQNKVEYISLRVLKNNTSALTLYNDLGFINWDGLIEKR